MVDRLIKVLDEDVALTGASEGGVTLRPHDTAGIAAQPLVSFTTSLRDAMPLLTKDGL